MRHVLAVIGPRDAGPGERQEMLARARALLEQAGAGEIDRIDVPAKGGGDDDPEGALRTAVESIVPALQSGSLFGDRRGVMVVDADQLLAAEAAVSASWPPRWPRRLPPSASSPPERSPVRSLGPSRTSESRSR